ncbi:hypothetical protein ATI61_12352 [Archangium gephyra]|uniref:Uncharacterized protein n=1 Tax=Archangium gephyra TaxID=48 RepID=A0AAC8TIN9_9BACT|nr:hypothetical protein [Archangium gephyra]AKJ07502.1 Hypothetical protein AA314_09128 [Archangium gephyra]REG19101.1 hypothetical protein ATI61_12352 [Archangium gephyra]
MPASDERRLQALVLAPVRRVRRRLNAVLWTEAAVAPVWAAATGCVLARLLWRDAAAWVLPVPLLAAGAWCFVRARARSVSLTHAAVLADRSAGAGGLLLTRLERPVGEWELSANQYARAVTLPPVAWKRPVGALLAALAFLAVGFLLPLPARRVGPANAAAAAKVAAVQAKAEALAREEPLGAPLEEELRRLSEEVAEGRFDSTDWEAADSLEKSLEARAAKAAAELATASEAARELEESLDAAAGAEAATREREALENALMALGSDTAAQRQQQGQEEGNPASGNSGGAPGAGDGGTRGQAEAKQGGSGGARSRDEVASLRETLERRQRELEQRFGQGNGRNGRNGSRPGEGEGEGEGQGRQDGHASRQTRPGKGGVSRGGESQPLVFGDKAEMDPERLDFKPLPKGQGGEAQGLWGLRSAEPQRSEGRGGGGGGQGTGAQGDAEAGHSAGPLLPRNRDLVKRYFGGEP